MHRTAASEYTSHRDVKRLEGRSPTLTLTRALVLTAVGPRVYRLAARQAVARTHEAWPHTIAARSAAAR